MSAQLTNSSPESEALKQVWGLLHEPLKEFKCPNCKEHDASLLELVRTEQRAYSIDLFDTGDFTPYGDEALDRPTIWVDYGDAEFFDSTGESFRCTYCWEDLTEYVERLIENGQLGVAE